jgi:hypothetical protein
MMAMLAIDGALAIAAKRLAGGGVRAEPAM